MMVPRLGPFINQGTDNHEQILRRFFCRNRIVEGTDALGHFDEIEHIIIKVYGQITVFRIIDIFECPVHVIGESFTGIGPQIPATDWA